MKTLFIDTHSEKVLLGICNESKLTIIEKTSEKSHSEIVIPSLNELLENTKLTLNDIDEIIVVNGPGSFTGVRIGVTIAKTIAYSLNIPIKTITSLEAYGVSDNKSFDIVTVKDSKGVYSALYKNNAFVDFSYRKNGEFEAYVKETNYKICDNSDIDILKVIDYLKNKDYTNPHAVNPIYIKEIDALKWLENYQKINTI